MSKEKLVQNTFFFTLALTIQKAISFVYFIFIARAISVEDLGKYSFALSFSTIFAMFLDFGMAQVLVRESARDKNNSQKYLSNVLGIKLIASVFVYLLVVVTVNLLGYPDLTKKLVYVSGLVMVLDSFGLIFYSVLRGLQNLIFESLGVIFNQIIILIIGLLVLKFNLGLVVLIGVYFIGSLFNLVYAASRPDILTTVTTVAALFPTIYGVGGGRGNSDPNSNGTCIWITVLKFADPFSYAVALYD